MTDNWNAIENPHDRAGKWDGKHNQDHISWLEANGHVAEAEAVAASYYSQEQESSSGRQIEGELYVEGLQAFLRYGFFVELDPIGDRLYHSVYRHSLPPAIQGIAFPGSFRVYRPIVTMGDEDAISRIIKCEMSEEASKFWLPFLVRQPNRVTDLQAYCERLMALEIKARQADEGRPFRLGIAHRPSVADTTPKCWLPEADWFADTVRQLTFRDIFTLFPEPEAKIIQLALGRSLLGPNRTLPIGYQEPIETTLRSIPVIVGEDPGMGKSTIFRYLFSATSKAGFLKQTFADINDPINRDRVVLSHFAYKDDTTNKSLAQLLSSEVTKIVATGGELRSRNLYEAANVQWTRSVIWCNANEYDPRIVYGLDPGIVARIDMVSTYRESEVDKDLLPFFRLPRLAESLDVDLDAIMLWACRLSVDYYESLLPHQAVERDSLETEVKQLRSQLRIQLHKDSTQAIIIGMACTAAVAASDRRSFDPDQWQLQTPQMNELKTLMENFYFFTTDRLCHELRESLRVHYENTGRSTLHPYVGVKSVSPSSIRAAFDEFDICRRTNQPFEETLIRVFKILTFTDGFAASKDRVWILKAWESARSRQRSIVEAAVFVYSRMTGEEKDRFCSPTRPSIDNNWIIDGSYSPN